MINESEAKRLRKICEELANPVELILCNTEESEFGRKLAGFAGELSSLSQGKILPVAGGSDAGLPACPCFKVRGAGGTGIIYAALPAGHQFMPFTRALELAGSSCSTAPGSNAEFQVFISEHCPHCPAAVEAAIQLAGRDSSITVCVVDAAQFPELARQYGIKSVPATVLDRQLVVTGNITAVRLAELVEIRGTRKFEMEVVRSLIETGRIAEAAGCLDHDAGREVILALLQDAEFSKRLSGLVVMEKALDDSPDAVRGMVPSLAGMLSHADSRIRGDVADLLGKIGDPQVIPQLEPLTSDPDPDVAEAAADAIAELRRRAD